MPIVDIHCHTFNADDLPVRGFIRSTKFDDSRLGDLIGALSDRFAQGQAPGFTTEKRELDHLLASESFAEAFEVSPPAAPDPAAELDRDTKRVLAELQKSDPALLQEVGTALATEEQGELEGFADWFSASKRAVRWVNLFGRSRLDNTVLLMDNFDDRIDLYTPLLVDLDMGLHDAAKTRLAEQVELHEKISRLSMLERLPRVRRGRVHPFMAFDPRRQVRDVIAGDVRTTFDILQEAVATYGFIGVKVYPPMGFKPIGNTAIPGLMTAQVAAKVDEALVDLYEWCQREDVPITAHTARSNEANDKYVDFASPDNWANVLSDFPRLRLNLGHFGGADRTAPADDWTAKIARLATPAHPNLFADVGNHDVWDTGLTTAYIAMLKALFTATGTSQMAERLMFGSDWYMVAIHPEHDRFLDQYEEAYRDAFGDDATDAFLGGTAMRFLGLDDAGSGNSKRLAARYAKYAPGREPDWLLR